MSEKNFVAYGDAESILTGYANRIKQSPTTFVGTQAQWNALSSSQKAEYELVDITDDEFSPNNFVDWGSYSILGAKNLLPVTMASQVLSGVTFTVDSASGIIGVSGNNSGTPFSDVIGTTLLKPGTYKVTTGQATELNAQIGIAVTNASSGTILARSWNGTEVFTISSDTQVKFHIEVNVTGTITSTTIYPTCKLDSIKDDSYVPFVMTNKQLTDEAYDNHAWSVTFNGQWFVAMYAPGMKPTIYLNVPIKPSKALLTYSNLAVQYFNGSSWQNATINACNYNARLNAINISLDGIPESFVSSHSNVLCSITGTFAIT